MTTVEFIIIATVMSVFAGLLGMLFSRSIDHIGDLERRRQRRSGPPSAVSGVRHAK